MLLLMISSRDKNEGTYRGGREKKLINTETAVMALYSIGPAIVQGCVQIFHLHYSGHLHYSEECLNSAGSALLRIEHPSIIVQDEALCELMVWRSRFNFAGLTKVRN